MKLCALLLISLTTWIRPSGDDEAGNEAFSLRDVSDSCQTEQLARSPRNPLALWRACLLGCFEQGFPETASEMDGRPPESFFSFIALTGTLMRLVRCTTPFGTSGPAAVSVRPCRKVHFWAFFYHFLRAPTPQTPSRRPALSSAYHRLTCSPPHLISSLPPKSPHSHPKDRVSRPCMHFPQWGEGKNRRFSFFVLLLVEPCCHTATRATP